MEKAAFPRNLTFITNERGEKLRDRLLTLIKDCEEFDCIVGYFYVSGFYRLYPALESTKRIRILVGMGISQETFDLIKGEYSPNVKKDVEEYIKKEMAKSEDNIQVERGIEKFIQWVRMGKLQIKAHESRKLHAKVYIMTFKEGDRDPGRVITGSSNLTYRGLVDNLEFNVELTNPNDYYYAKDKFEELWKDAVDISEDFVKTIEEKTWYRSDIEPYKLYLKLLYEYFRDELEQEDELNLRHKPENFKELQYQRDAVLSAKKILEAYGGCFLADVVGLGKTYMATLLASQLDGKTAIIAPKALIDRNNPGSWSNAISEFGIRAKTFPNSLKGLEDLEKEKDDYKNIIIDEAHHFRNEYTERYNKLARICKNKRVILVSATPYNNTLNDLLSLIKLFQNAYKSHIPGIPNLEEFFKNLEKKLKEVDKKDPEYTEIVKQNAAEVRNKVLRYLMIRRTRKDIEKYYEEDLKQNNIKFPKVQKPNPVYYQLNQEEEELFNETLKVITEKLTYSRYTPLLYLKGKPTHMEIQAEKNLRTLMKILLFKRLESSFYSFKQSLERMIKSYEDFINAYKKGKVYISKHYTGRIFELLEEDSMQEIEEYITSGKAQEYDAKAFEEKLIEDLEQDLKHLKDLKNKWDRIKTDPKLFRLKELLEDIFKEKDKGKVVIFTESKETGEYLRDNLDAALLFHGGCSEEVRNKVIENFDAGARNKKDDYKILISTDVLSEGVNLHRANVVINYDIPWNPTKIMQRVGRVNRIGTPFDKIYVYNFFPTAKSEEEIDLTKIARAKVESFLTLLGDDAEILMEGEPVSSHELFDIINSERALMGDEEEEGTLSYLEEIKRIKKEDPKLFEEIKSLPPKARCGVKDKEKMLITFFRKGKLTKFFVSKDDEVKEVDFLKAVEIFSKYKQEKPVKFDKEEYHRLFEKNKKSFDEALKKEESNSSPPKGIAKKLLQMLKALKKEHPEHQELIDRYIQQVEKGAIHKRAMQKLYQELQDTQKDPLQVLEKEKELVEPSGRELKQEEEKEIILSLYITGG